MNTEENTDGKLNCWDCSISIVGCKLQGYDLKCIPYTMGDGDWSAPHEIAMKITNCEGSFKTKQQARAFAQKCGFVPDSEWGEMSS